MSTRHSGRPLEAAPWLRQRFGLKDLRLHQDTVVQALLEGKRVLFVAPTGHGKSLCYQALAAHPQRRGVVLVFQPLKALMQEQVERARAQGLRAALVNSDQEPEEQGEVLRSAAEGELDLLFLAPERQGNELWLEQVPEMEIKGVVIDEAHCISQWGHDFRPWYRRLVETIRGLGRRTPVLAITATAPAEVVEDIREQIAPGDGEIQVIRLDSYRPNLACEVWEVQGLEERLAALLHIARRFKGQPGLAYLLTTAEVQMAADFLCQQRINAVAYYGRLDFEERRRRFSRWVSDEVSIICATSALGMGMDRADVRWVAHLGLPDSLIRYVQEIGRAGRDNKPATVIAVHDPDCKGIYEGLRQSSQPDPQKYQLVAGELRKGAATRKDIVERHDMPEMTVQRVLDDLVQEELCTRSGSPASYSWVGRDGSPIPEGTEEALEVRVRFLKAVLDYPQQPGCRAFVLARAMGDREPPEQCRRCDRCRGGNVQPDLTSESALARAYMDSFTPPIGKRKLGSTTCHQDGVALSLYGVGNIGRAVQRSKYHNEPAPDVVLDRATKVLSQESGAYAGVQFSAVVFIPSTSSGSFVKDFATRLARRLGVPCVDLRKSRETRQQKSFRSKHNKRRNVDGAFCLPPGAKVSGNVLLVDDICDSGESLLHAAKALRPATVYPLTMARTRHTDDQ